MSDTTLLYDRLKAVFIHWSMVNHNQLNDRLKISLALSGFVITNDTLAQLKNSNQQAISDLYVEYVERSAIQEFIGEYSCLTFDADAESTEILDFLREKLFDAALIDFTGGQSGAGATHYLTDIIKEELISNGWLPSLVAANLANDQCFKLFLDYAVLSARLFLHFFIPRIEKDPVLAKTFASQRRKDNRSMKWYGNDFLGLAVLYEKLSDEGCIQCTLLTFKKTFSGKPVANKIKWNGNQTALCYLMHKLHDQGTISISGEIWITLREFFDYPSRNEKALYEPLKNGDKNFKRKAFYDSLIKQLLPPRNT